MADGKVRLIIEVDDKDVKATEASLNRLGVAAKKVGSEGVPALNSTEKAAGGVAKEVQNAAKSFVGAAAGAGPFASILGTIATAGGAAGVVLAVVGVALVSIWKTAFSVTKSFAEYATQTSRVRDETGLLLKTTSALKFGMEATGGSFDAAGSGVKNFEKLIGKANDGSKEALATMVRLGIDPVKAAKNLDGAFAQVFVRIQNLPEGVQRTTAAMDAFGDSGTKMLPMIKAFNGGVDEMEKRAKALGVSLSEDDVRSAAEFEKALNTIKETATAVGIAFGRELSGPVIQDLNDINSALDRNKGSVAGWAKYVTEAFEKLTINIRGNVLAIQQLENDLFGSAGLGMGNNSSPDAHEQLQKAIQEEKQRAIDYKALGVAEQRIGKLTSWNTPSPDDMPDYTLHPEWFQAPYNVAGPEKEKKAKKPPKAPHAVADEMQKFFEDQGFVVTRTLGAELNKGSLHPLGRAADVSVRGKNIDQITSLVAAALEHGYRLFDERVKRDGVFQTGSHLHFEKNQNKASGFLDQKFYNVPIDYLKSLDHKRLGKGTVLPEEVGKFLEQQSDIITKDAHDQNVRAIAELWKRLGFIPDDKFLGEITKLAVQDARKSGQMQPNENDIRQQFKDAQLSRATIAETTQPQLTTGIQSRLDAQVTAYGEQFNITQRLEQLTFERENHETVIGSLLQDQILARGEIKQRLTNELELLQKSNIVEDAGVSALAERVSLSREIRDLQIEMMNQGQNDGLKIEAAHLRDILEDRQAELNAVIAIQHAQFQLSKAMDISNNEIRAGIYEHMAQQKTLNEGIVDGINGTYDAILRRMNEPLDKLNEKSKGFLSFITEPLKAVQAQGLNKVFSGIVDSIFPGASAAMEKAKNPVVGELKDHTKLLEQIAKNTGALPTGYNPTTGGGIAGVIQNLTGGRASANGPGGTPNYNPAAGKGAGGILPTGSTDANGNVVVNGNEQRSGLFGSLKDMFAPKRNILTKKNSSLGGIMNGIGGIASMAGGLIGGRFGGILSMAGRGAQIGSMFGPWGAAIGAGVGALIGLFGHRDDAENKLKQAAASQFGIAVKDKGILSALKSLGEGMFGKGKVGANAVAVVRSEQGMNILRAYAESSNQSGLKIDRLNMGDPNWSGNDFRSQFGGFRANGGNVFAGRAYVVGERRPELFVPHVNGTIMPAVSNVSTTSGMDAKLIGKFMETMDRVHETLDKLDAVPYDHVVAKGLPNNTRGVAAAYHSELDNDGRTSEAFTRLTGNAT